MMAGWEYKFVDLFRGNQPRGSTGFEALVEEIRRAGEDGWETVGELSVTYRPDRGCPLPLVGQDAPPEATERALADHRWGNKE